MVVSPFFTYLAYIFLCKIVIDLATPLVKYTIQFSDTNVK